MRACVTGSCMRADSGRSRRRRLPTSPLWASLRVAPQHIVLLTRQSRVSRILFVCNAIVQRFASGVKLDS